MNTLVSVIIVTYNSSEFIIETLESVKEQSYKIIELIITDDASTDNTVLKCEQWLSENKSHFLSTKLITIDKNSGIVANRNRGLSAASGEWVKFT
jgi:glycosyltransferase involved in cell wall biosynthesis